MPRLRVAVSDSPLRTEHERLLRTALRRGDEPPEPAPGAKLEADHPAEAIAIARAVWLARMEHEHRSSAVFSRLLPQLMEAEAPLEFKTAVLRMSMDELRHAALCGAVVELLGGVAELETSLATEPLPEHADATPLERALRNVVFVGCMSETVSIALLTEERELTTEPIIVRVVEQLGADEVLHAKLGWSFLAHAMPSLDASARERADRYLRVAFGHLEDKMLEAMPLGPERDGALRAHLDALGVMDARDARELFYATVDGVIVPRLADHGLDAASAWRERKRSRLTPTAG